MRRKDFLGLRLGKPRRLTCGLANHEQPAISPDGRWLAYYAGNLGSVELLLCDTAGRLARRISPFSGNSAHAVWHPSGTRLAYAHQHFFDTKWELWETRLLPQPDGDLDPDEPQPGPDGALVAHGNPATDPRLLLADRHWNYLDPCYSPDGARVAYASDEQGDRTFQLWLLDLASSERQQLTFSAGADHRQPVFSPDGARVAFQVRPAHGAPGLATFLCELDLRSGDVTQLPEDGRNAHPQYLTGEVLLYDHAPDGDTPTQLWALSLKHGVGVALTGGKSSNRQPGGGIDAKGRPHLAWASKKLGAERAGEPNTYDIFIAPLKW